MNDNGRGHISQAVQTFLGVERRRMFPVLAAGYDSRLLRVEAFLSYHRTIVRLIVPTMVGLYLLLRLQILKAERVAAGRLRLCQIITFFLFAMNVLSGEFFSVDSASAVIFILKTYVRSVIR